MFQIFLPKLYRVLLIFMVTVTLAACGGGGPSEDPTPPISDVIPFSLNSTPDGVNESYQGKKTSAQLTPEMSLSLLESYYSLSFTRINIDSLDSQSKVKQKTSLSKTVKRAVSDGRNGFNSGSYRISGDINDLGQGVLTAVWNDFSDFQGSRINGSVVLNVVEFDPDYEVITKSTTRYNSLEIEENGESVVIYGNVIESIELHRSTTTIYDIALNDIKTNTWRALDKLKEVRNDNLDYEITGRYYRSDVGYVDISTLRSIRDCLNCTPNHPEYAGQLRFADSNDNTATFEFVDEKKINLEFKDSSQNESSTFVESWTAMESWKHENSPPYVRVRLPDYHPSNEDIVAQVETIDSDLDELTILSYKWKVNNVVISGNNTDTLAEANFKAGDSVSVEVSVTDGIHQPVTDLIGVIIYNTRVSLELDDITISLGEEAILDASAARDHDGDTLHFHWLGDIGFGSNIETPDAIKTKVSFTKAGTYSFGIRIEEERNGEIVQTTLKSMQVTVLEHDIFEVSQEVTTFPDFYNMDISAVRVADIVSNQGNEILVAFKNYSGGSYTGKIALISASDSFQPQLIDTGESSDSLIKMNSIVVRDMNSDGVNDILVPRTGGFAILYQETIFPGIFTPYFYASETSLSDHTIQLETGDFNNDGRIDVVIMQEGVKNIEVFLQLENTDPIVLDEVSGDALLRPVKFEEPVSYQTSAASRGHQAEAQMRVADISNDNLDDIVIVDELIDLPGFANDFDLLVLKQNAAGGFDEAINFDLPDDRYNDGATLGLGDFNNDQLTDIVVAPWFTDIGNTLDIYHQTGAGTFGEPSLLGTEHDTEQLVVADIDNNGFDDIVYKHDHRSLTIHKQGKDNHISNAWNNYDLETTSSFIHNTFDVGDINDDGKKDVVYAGDSSIIVLLGK